MTKPILPPEPVALDSPVSICIGSDQYAAMVVRVTPKTVVAQIIYRSGNEGRNIVFRPIVQTSVSQLVDGQWCTPTGWRSSDRLWLRVGECETHLDPSF